MVTPTEPDLTNNALSEEASGFDALQEIGSWISAEARARKAPLTSLLDELEIKLYQTRKRSNSTHSFQRAGDLLRASALTPSHKRFLPAKAPTVLTDLLHLSGMPATLRHGTLTLVAGAASAERTQLLADFAILAAERGTATALFSMGTSSDHFVRMISTRANVARRDDSLNDGNQMIETAHRLGDAPLYIDDTSALDLHEIRARTRRLARNAGGLAVVVIDSLTQMSENCSRLAVEFRADALKHLAKELRCNVVACIDLPGSSEPSVDALRAVGNMDLSADAVLFISEDAGTTAFVAAEAS